MSYQFTIEGDFPWAEGLSTSIAAAKANDYTDSSNPKEAKKNLSMFTKRAKRKHRLKQKQI